MKSLGSDALWGNQFGGWLTADGCDSLPSAPMCATSQQVSFKIFFVLQFMLSYKYHNQFRLLIHCQQCVTILSPKDSDPLWELLTLLSPPFVKFSVQWNYMKQQVLVYYYICLIGVKYIIKD